MSDAAVSFDDLLQAARAGDRAALSFLLAACQSFLRARANRARRAELRPKCGDSDLVQDTLTAAYENFARFVGTGEEQFRAWLRAILDHRAANLSRRFCPSTRQEVSLQTPGLEELLPSQRSGPVQRAERGEKQERIARAFTALPLADRELVRLHLYEKWEFAAIAVRLGRTVAAVRKHWSRALIRWAHEVKRLEGGAAVG
jgi:RNA polymerase sigma-70 factor, ECF subfamily